MKCSLSTLDFARLWDEQLTDEMDSLQEELDVDMRERIAGQWVMKNEDQAVWRAPAAKQFPDKFPDWDWGASSGKLARPAELIYLRKRGKIILDGPDDVRRPLMRVLKRCRTEPDDHAIMPVYDKNKMERFP